MFNSGSADPDAHVGGLLAVLIAPLITPTPVDNREYPPDSELPSTYTAIEGVLVGPGQVAFGASIAFAYSVLLILHVQYTMFYSVTAICVIRGAWLLARSLRVPSAVSATLPASPAAGVPTTVPVAPGIYEVERV